MSIMQEFKAFVMRGNVIDLAIAVVLGAAFGAVVTAFVEDIITPIIAAIGGQPDFSNLKFTINKSQFLYGHFINAVLAFLIIAAVLFFFVVKPMNALLARARREPPADPTTMKCPYCLSEIPIGATRCAFCTADVSSAAAAAPAS
jgi:large conductance mechanosensitive channel